MDIGHCKQDFYLMPCQHNWFTWEFPIFCVCFSFFLLIDKLHTHPVDLEPKTLPSMVQLALIRGGSAIGAMLANILFLFKRLVASFSFDARKNRKCSDSVPSQPVVTMWNSQITRSSDLHWFTTFFWAGPNF